MTEPLTAERMVSKLAMKRELGRIQRALHDKTTTAETLNLLYAAQQALAWALDRRMAMRPFKCIMSNKAGHL